MCTVYAEKAKITVKAENIDSTVNRLSWSKVKGAKSYIIYAFDEETEKYKKLSEINGTACKIKNLKPNSKYTYIIGAKLNNGKIGAVSEPVSLYTINYMGRSLTSFSDIFSSQITGQGEWIYFVKDDSSCEAGIYKIKKDGADLTFLKNGHDLHLLNVVGEKIYYINEKKDCVFSCDLNGKNECIELDISKCLSDYDDYIVCEIIDLIVVDNRIYCEIQFYENHETDIFSEWYKYDLDSKDELIKLFYGNVNIIDINNTNIITIEKSPQTIPDSYGNEYICKYDINKDKGAYSILFPDSYLKLSYSDPDDVTNCNIPYIEYDGSNSYCYLCDIDNGKSYLIKDANSIYKYNNIIYCNTNGIINEYKAGSSVNKYSSDCYKVNSCICYADNACIVLLNKYGYNSESKMEFEYIVINKNTSEWFTLYSNR